MKTAPLEAPAAPSPEPRRSDPRGAPGDEEFDGALRDAAAEGDPAARAEAPADGELADGRGGDGALEGAHVAAAELTRRADPGGEGEELLRSDAGVGDASALVTALAMAAGGPPPPTPASQAAPDGSSPTAGASPPAGAAGKQHRPSQAGFAAAEVAQLEPRPGTDSLSATSREAAVREAAAAAPLLELPVVVPRAAPTPAPIAEAPSVAPVELQAIRHVEAPAAADGAVLQHSAHLRVEAPGVGELELHLRVRDGIAHLRVDGDAARVIESRVADLSRALASQGLELGTLDVREPEAFAGFDQGGAAPRQHRDSGRERDEAPPRAPVPDPPRRSAAPAAPPASVGRYAVRA